jgi:protein involved in polysaccharide export with SLBB domain
VGDPQGQAAYDLKELGQSQKDSLDVSRAPSASAAPTQPPVGGAAPTTTAGPTEPHLAQQQRPGSAGADAPSQSSPSAAAQTNIGAASQGLAPAPRLIVARGLTRQQVADLFACAQTPAGDNRVANFSRVGERIGPSTQPVLITSNGTINISANNSAQLGSKVSAATQVLAGGVAAAVTQPSPEPRFATGDTVQLVLRDSGGAESVNSLPVDSNGEISVPLIGRVNVTGLTAQEAAERIYRSYSQPPGQVTVHHQPSATPAAPMATPAQTPVATSGLTSSAATQPAGTPSMLQSVATITTRPTGTDEDRLDVVIVLKSQDVSAPSPNAAAPGAVPPNVAAEPPAPQPSTMPGGAPSTAP